MIPKPVLEKGRNHMRKTVLCLAITCIGLAAAVSLSAAGAPGVTVLDSLQNTYSPVTFDHEKHAAIAGNCAACHHEHSAGAGLPCKQCHSLTPATFKKTAVHSFMPCKNCHGALNRDDPGTPGLKVAYHRACFTCHRGMGNIGTDPRGCTELCHAKKPDKLRAAR
jgi:hypothetical protein